MLTTRPRTITILPCPPPPGQQPVSSTKPGTEPALSGSPRPQTMRILTLTQLMNYQFPCGSGPTRRPTPRQAPINTWPEREQLPIPAQWDILSTPMITAKLISESGQPAAPGELRVRVHQLPRIPLLQYQIFMMVIGTM